MQPHIPYRPALLLVVQLLAIPVVVTGQQESPRVQFHGSNTTVAHYSNMPGAGQGMPPSYYRNDLRMTLMVYDVPVSASFFITSLQTFGIQNLNNFRISLDVAALAKNKKLAEIKALAEPGVDKLEKAKGELEKYKNQLTTMVQEKAKTLKTAEEEYNKAKEELKGGNISDLRKVEKVSKLYEKGKTKLIDTLQHSRIAAKAKGKYDSVNAFVMRTAEKGTQQVEKVKAKVETLKLKVASARAKLNETTAKLAEVENRLKKYISKLETARSLANTGTLLNKGESLVKSYGLSKFGRVLSMFSTLEFGNCHPNYSEFILKGIPLSGINIEVTPGNFYLAFATGEVRRTISPFYTTPMGYDQTLTFGKTGFGKKSGSHVFFSFMKAGDKAGSAPDGVGINAQGVDTLHLSPRSNYVAGTEVRIALFKMKLLLDGEVAASLFTRNTDISESVPGNGDVPDWINNFFKPNISSSVDYAYAVKSTLNLNTTKVSVEARMVGPGFISLGNPFLINDRMTFEGRIDQTFSKNQVVISAYSRQSHDRMAGVGKSATNVNSYGITAGFRFKKLPYLQFSYMPFFQQTRSESVNMKNSVLAGSASAGYDYMAGKQKLATTVSFFYQGMETVIDSGTIKNVNQSLSVSQEIALKIPLGFNASFTYNRLIYSLISRNIFLFTLSGTYGAFKNKWQNNVGVQFAKEERLQEKFGFFVNSRVLLGKMADFEIRLEKNSFRNNLAELNSYNQFIAQAALTIKW